MSCGRLGRYTRLRRNALDGGLEDEANNRKFVEIILNNAIRLNNIASDLLVISELDSNAVPAAPPERSPCTKWWMNAYHTVERAAEAKRFGRFDDNAASAGSLATGFA